MTTGRPTRVVLCAIAVVLATAAGAAAQTNDEFFQNFQWSFSTPGARANAMGRAFIGLADDATATITNPAGLVSLTRPQMYIEYKNTDLKVDRQAAADSLVNSSSEEFKKDINALSFFDVSMPVGDSKRFAVGVTYDQFLNYQENFNLDARQIPGSAQFFFPVTGAVDFKGSTFGLSGSAVISPKLNVGVTVSINRLSADSSATRDNFTASLPPADSGIIGNRTSINGSNVRAGISFGALYKASDMISIGAVGVISPKFKLSENKQINPGFCGFTNPQVACPVAGTNPPGVNRDLVNDSAFPVDVKINVPNRFGAGVGVRPNSRWVFAADAVWIGYSALTKDVTLIFDSDVLNGTEYKTNDVVETHLGAEYNLSVGNTPVFLRGGLFTSPNHTPKFTGTSDPEVNADNDALYNSLSRKMETRGTAGAGFVFGQNIQLDLAYVFGKEFVASAAYRFK